MHSIIYDKLIYSLFFGDSIAHFMYRLALVGILKHIFALQCQMFSSSCFEHMQSQIILVLRITKAMYFFSSKSNRFKARSKSSSKLESKQKSGFWGNGWLILRYNSG